MKSKWIRKSIWNVKDDFTGKIEGEAIKEGETPTLYDKENRYDLYL